MYESRLFNIAAGGVVGIFSIAVGVEAIAGHDPIEHVEFHITQPAPGVFSTSSTATSSGTVLG